MFAMGGGHLAGLLIAPGGVGQPGWLGVDSPLRRGGPVGTGSSCFSLSSPLVRGGSALEGLARGRFLSGLHPS